MDEGGTGGSVSEGSGFWRRGSRPPRTGPGGWGVALDEWGEVHRARSPQGPARWRGGGGRRGEYSCRLLRRGASWMRDRRRVQVRGRPLQVAVAAGSMAEFECEHCGRSGHTRDLCRRLHGLCYRCGSPGHRLFRCPTVTCRYCRRPGHWLRDCRRRLGSCLRCGSPEHWIAGCSLRRPASSPQGSAAVPLDSGVGSSPAHGGSPPKTVHFAAPESTFLGPVSTISVLHTSEGAVSASEEAASASKPGPVLVCCSVQTEMFGGSPGVGQEATSNSEPGPVLVCSSVQTEVLGGSLEVVREATSTSEPEPVLVCRSVQTEVLGAGGRGGVCFSPRCVAPGPFLDSPF